MLSYLSSKSFIFFWVISSFCSKAFSKFLSLSILLILFSILNNFNLLSLFPFSTSSILLFKLLIFLSFSLLLLFKSLIWFSKSFNLILINSSNLNKLFSKSSSFFFSWLLGFKLLVVEVIVLLIIEGIWTFNLFSKSSIFLLLFSFSFW